MLLYWEYINTHWSVLRGRGFVGAFIMKYIPEAVAFICCALTSAIKTGAVPCRAVDGDFPLRLNSFKRFIYRAVYRHHVSHRHHHDNNHQDIRGERPEPGLHPDHPGTAQDRTAGKSWSGGQTPGLYPVLPGFVCAWFSKDLDTRNFNCEIFKRLLLLLIGLWCSEWSAPDGEILIFVKTSIQTGTGEQKTGPGAQRQLQTPRLLQGTSPAVLRVLVLL